VGRESRLESNWRGVGEEGDPEEEEREGRRKRRIWVRGQRGRERWKCGGGGIICSGSWGLGTGKKRSYDLKRFFFFPSLSVFCVCISVTVSVSVSLSLSLSVSFSLPLPVSLSLFLSYTFSFHVWFPSISL